MDLIEFLRARLDEDEGYVRELLSPSASYATFRPDWDLSASAIVETGDESLFASHRLLA